MFEALAACCAWPGGVNATSVARTIQVFIEPPPLVRLRPGVLYQARPEQCILGEESREVPRRSRAGSLGPFLGERAVHLRVLQHDPRGIEQALHDLGRRARGNEEAVPEGDLVIRQAGFRHARYSGTRGVRSRLVTASAR